MQLQTADFSSKKPTVLQLVTGLGVGGAERVVLELASALGRQGFRSVVVALNDDAGLLAQYGCSEIPIYMLGVKKTPWSFIKATFKLINIMRREQVSLVHAHMFHALLLALMCKLAKPACKLVFTSHSSMGFTFIRRLLIQASKPLRSADIVFTTGQHSEMNAKHTLVIPNGVPVSPKWVAPERGVKDRLVFLFVGRLEPVKNPLALVRSFAEVRHQNCELWLAGDGSMRSEVISEINRLGIEHRVHLLGIRRDVPQLLFQVDCFVITSHWEGLPMAVLEAGAAALPVVATPVGAIPELLEGGYGYLAEISEFSCVLDSVMDDYTEANMRGERLRDKIVNEYSLEHMCRAHADLYSGFMLNN